MSVQSWPSGELLGMSSTGHSADRVELDSATSARLRSLSRQLGISVAETLALAVEQFAAPKRPKPKAAKPPEAKSGRGLSARIAAHESWAATADRSARTANARSRFDQRFLDQVDPERVLSERERAIRAEHARKAYFLEMARKSAESRRKKAATP